MVTLLSSPASSSTACTTALHLLEEDGGVVEQALQGSQALRPPPSLLHAEEKTPAQLPEFGELLLQLLSIGREGKLLSRRLCGRQGQAGLCKQASRDVSRSPTNASGVVSAAGTRAVARGVGGRERHGAHLHDKVARQDEPHCKTAAPKSRSQTLPSVLAGLPSPFGKGSVHQTSPRQTLWARLRSPVEWHK